MYQTKNIQVQLNLTVSRIRQVVEKMGDDEQQVCDEKDGWCVIGTTDKLRDIISSMIKTVIRAQNPREENAQHTASFTGGTVTREHTSTAQMKHSPLTRDASRPRPVRVST